MKKLLIVIFALAAVSLAGCAPATPAAEPTGVQETARPLTVAAPSDLETAETAEFREDYVSITIPIPEGWSYRVNEHEGEPAGGQGLVICKSGDESRAMRLIFTEFMGVCGTGLVQREADFPSGHSAVVGYYDGSEDWSFVSFNDTAGGYFATNIGLTGEDAEEGLQILGQAKLGGDWLTKSQAESIARETVGECDYVNSSFDPVSGLWTVTMGDGGGKEPKAVITIDCNGNIVD